MKEKCEAFGIEVVRAIREGRQNQDRRPIKDTGLYAIDPAIHGSEVAAKELSNLCKAKAPWKVGDIIIVRESATVIDYGTAWSYKERRWIKTMLLRYESDAQNTWVDNPERISRTPRGQKLPNGTFREACRTRLKITRVWAERLRDISKAEAMAEGCFQDSITTDLYPYWHSTKHPVKGSWQCWASWQQAMEKLWDSFYGNGPYAWDKNPWVWCREFEVMK